MRVALLSHAGVATRQALFGAALRSELERRGDTLLEYYPAKWGPHQRPDGLEVYGEGDQSNYTFTPEGWQRIREDQPQLVVVQQEPYCLVSFQVRAFCARHNIPYVVFTWDNLLRPMGPGLDVLRDAAHVVCGNQDAERLVQEAIGVGKTSILPQVGLDPTLFRPLPDHLAPAHDIVFAGRPDPMKGEDVLDAATRGTGWRVLKGHRAGHLDYHHMADRYQAAKIQCTPSRDVAGRPREQFAPYASLEGGLCGVPLVTTTQPAIREWMVGAPGTLWAEQGDAEGLHDALDTVLAWDHGARVNAGLLLRDWVAHRFSNDVVARQWADLIAMTLEVPA